MLEIEPDDYIVSCQMDNPQPSPKSLSDKDAVQRLDGSRGINTLKI